MAEYLQKQALVKSLLFSSLLAENLEGSTCFDRSLLKLPSSEIELNLEQKLGHLYEDALQILLEHSDDLDLVAKNLQIFNRERRTLGELDYVLRRGDEVIHLELAAKFYMVHFDGEKACYPGPDPTDNWQNKLRRMEDHQLLISKNEDAKELLSERFDLEVTSVQHLIYGRLFDHILEKRRPVPRGISSEADRSVWLYVEEWREHFAADVDIFVIPKSLWVVPVSEMGEELLESLGRRNVEETLAEVRESSRCSLVYCRGFEAPIFVVPMSWPAV